MAVITKATATAALNRKELGGIARSGIPPPVDVVRMQPVAMSGRTAKTPSQASGLVLVDALARGDTSKLDARTK